MNRLADGVIFRATAGSTTDWTVSAAIPGYMTPAQAGAVNTGVYSYRAESDDLTQWEMGVGTYSSTGAGSITRTTVLYNSAGTTAKINFTAAPKVGIVALSADVRPSNAYTEYTRDSSSFLTMVTDTPTTIVSGSFAAGKWIVQGNIIWAAQGTTQYTEIHEVVSVTSGSLEGSPAGGSTFADHLPWLTGQSSVRPTGIRYYDFAAATTVYLIGQVKVTAGSAMLAYGNLIGIPVYG